MSHFLALMRLFALFTIYFVLVSIYNLKIYKRMDSSVDFGGQHMTGTPEYIKLHAKLTKGAGGKMTFCQGAANISE